MPSSAKPTDGKPARSEHRQAHEPEDDEQGQDDEDEAFLLGDGKRHDR